MLGRSWVCTIEASALDDFSLIAQLILSPFAAVDHHFWPRRVMSVTTYGILVEGGLPTWIGCLWLLPVAYLLGALTGRVAHRLFLRLGNRG